MTEQPKLMSEKINDDLSATFDEMMSEMVEVNKEVTDGVREEEGEEKGKEEEVKTEEEISASEESKSEEELEPTEDEEKSEEDEEGKPEEETSFEPGSLKPNSVWDEETREAFTQLPEHMQEFMLKRDKEMTADYTRKTQEIAGIKRALDPVRDEIKEMGIDEGTAISNLVATHRLLKAKPFIGIQYLMMAYKMSPEEVQEKWQDPETFTQNIKEGTRLSRVENELDERRSSEQEAAYKANVVEIEEFAQDHPHFSAVEPKMKELVREALIAGEPKPSLQSLYDRALKALKDSGFSPAEESGKPKTGKEVKRAKKASTRLKSVPKKEASKPKKATTLHDDLSQGWDEGAKAAGA